MQVDIHLKMWSKNNKRTQKHRVMAHSILPVHSHTYEHMSTHTELCRQQWWSEDKRRHVSSITVTHIPQRVSVYYKTNNRKRCWQCSENSNNPHPCVSFLPFCCWLNFMTSFSLVSPRSNLAQSGLTLGSGTGYCFSHIVTRGPFVCPVTV